MSIKTPLICPACGAENTQGTILCILCRKPLMDAQAITHIDVGAKLRARAYPLLRFAMQTLGWVALTVALCLALMASPRTPDLPSFTQARFEECMQNLNGLATGRVAWISVSSEQANTLFRGYVIPTVVRQMRSTRVSGMDLSFMGLIIRDSKLVLVLHRRIFGRQRYFFASGELALEGHRLVFNPTRVELGMFIMPPQVLEYLLNPYEKRFLDHMMVPDCVHEIQMRDHEILFFSQPRPRGRW